MSNPTPESPNPLSAASDCSPVCPQCGSDNLGGLMSSFYVALMDDGVTAAGDWNDWSSESEMTSKRICYECDHEFEFD